MFSLKKMQTRSQKVSLIEKNMMGIHDLYTMHVFKSGRRSSSFAVFLNVLNGSVLLFCRPHFLLCVNWAVLCVYSFLRIFFKIYYKE